MNTRRKIGTTYIWMKSKNPLYFFLANFHSSHPWNFCNFGGKFKFPLKDPPQKVKDD